MEIDIMKNIPNDVLWVWAINASTPYVGSETYEKIQRIVDENPKYFVQEHIYRSIPQEVKDSFNTESISLYSKFYPPILTDREDGEGWSDWHKRQPVNTYDSTKGINAKELEKNLNYVFVEKPQKDKEYKKELKKLYDKHFKVFKYKFEE